MVRYDNSQEMKSFLDRVAKCENGQEREMLCSGCGRREDGGRQIPVRRHFREPGHGHAEEYGRYHPISEPIVKGSF